MSVAGQRKRLKDDAYYTPPWCVRALLSEVEIPRYLPILDPCAGDGAILRAFAAGERDSVVEVVTGRVSRFTRELYANEIREEERAGLVELCGEENVGIGDCRDLVLEDASAVVTNPPFALADDIVRGLVSPAVAPRVPFAAFLLRMNWLAPQKRNTLARRRPPTAIVVLPRRPCFAHYCTKPAKDRRRVCGRIYPKSYTGPCSGSVEEDTERGGSYVNVRCHGIVKAQTDAADYAWHVWTHREGFSRTYTTIHYAALEACE